MNTLNDNKPHGFIIILIIMIGYQAEINVLWRCAGEFKGE